MSKEDAMPEGLVRQEAPALFFRDRLIAALEHQRVSTSAFTEFYLVQLLAAFARGENLTAREPGFDEPPLALLYARALQASRFERAVLLRATADTALFVSGFFAESLPGGNGDVRYYASLGGRAYAALGREQGPEDPAGTAVFNELAERFLQFVDVLAEVSEKTRLTSPLSVVRLYERWAETGSRRAADLLAGLGITPMTPTGGARH
ncbi:MAG TPA: hypothetical protein VLF95_10810 [Vicinamibacteria bacterium]|nr:hypothetical protein [Vicinamibacteria bacterium]